jgi:hypothetical protein
MGAVRVPQFKVLAVKQVSGGLQNLYAVNPKRVLGGWNGIIKIPTNNVKSHL